MELTVSVTAFQLPSTPGTCGLAAELAFGAHFAGHRGDLVGEDGQRLDHAVDHLARSQERAFQRPAVDIQGDPLREITARHGGQDQVAIARHLGQVGQLRSHVGVRLGQLGELRGDARVGSRRSANCAFRLTFAESDRRSSD